MNSIEWSKLHGSPKTMMEKKKKHLISISITSHYIQECFSLQSRNKINKKSPD